MTVAYETTLRTFEKVYEMMLADGDPMDIIDAKERLDAYRQLCIDADDLRLSDEVV